MREKSSYKDVDHVLTVIHPLDRYNSYTRHHRGMYALRKGLLSVTIIKIKIKDLLVEFFGKYFLSVLKFVSSQSQN